MLGAIAALAHATAKGCSSRLQQPQMRASTSPASAAGVDQATICCNHLLQASSRHSDQNEKQAWQSFAGDVVYGKCIKQQVPEARSGRWVVFICMSAGEGTVRGQPAQL